MFSCAKARAVELMCAVAVTGVVGQTPGTTWNPTNVSGNAVYLPCEPSLGYSGIHAETPPLESHWGEGAILIARDIPVGAIRALRDNGPEVWPGAWTADHVRVSDPQLLPGSNHRTPLVPTSILNRSLTTAAIPSRRNRESASA